LVVCYAAWQKDWTSVGIPNPLRYREATCNLQEAQVDWFEPPEKYLLVGIINVAKTIHNPFGNGSYHLLMVKLGMVYGFVLPTLLQHYWLKNNAKSSMLQTTSQLTIG
jgi:hypothetical protein